MGMGMNIWEREGLGLKRHPRSSLVWGTRQPTYCYAELAVSSLEVVVTHWLVARCFIRQAVIRHAVMIQV